MRVSRTRARARVWCVCVCVGARTDVAVEHGVKEADNLGVGAIVLQKVHGDAVVAVGIEVVLQQPARRLS